MFNKEIIDKWTPIVEKHLGIKNTIFRYYTCLYFEFKCNRGEDISGDILEFSDKITTIEEFKFQISKEYINVLTGRKEYLLSNGKIYDPESMDYFFTTEQLVKVFGIEFITYLEPQIAREFKINKILKKDD